MPKIFLVAQNFDIYDGDSLDLFARTGSTSLEQLANAGAEGVILGHPEANDSPQVVKQKLKTVISRMDLLPATFQCRVTLMAGESWDDLQTHPTNQIASVIAKQVGDILSVVPKQHMRNFTIGYDPKWGSRGAGHDDVPPPGPAIIFQVAKAIRAMLADRYGEEIAAAVPIIYGGRSTPERTLEILANSAVDGLILGSACDTVEKTKAIAKAMMQAKPSGRKVLHANFKAYNLKDSYSDYVRMFRELNNEFTVLMSPCHADIRKAADAMAD